VIFKLLTLLKQNPPSELQLAPCTELFDWAIKNWNPALLTNSHEICNLD
jgi:glutamyl-Q tRNA(Asp) synthetase